MVTRYRVCAEPGCPVLSETSRCPTHTPKPWASSTHDQHLRTTSGWARQKADAQILRTYGRICHQCGTPGCTIVDHVIALADGGTDTPANKRPICRPCHQTKTAAEAARGRRRNR